jgi:hypothetical protein
MIQRANRKAPHIRGVTEGRDFTLAGALLLAMRKIPINLREV